MEQDLTSRIVKRKWRVFYTQSRAEKKCEERLAERRVEVFLPKHKVVRQWKDRKKKVVEPLFRNYIFAHVDEHERLRVLKTPGIVRCVSFGSTPAEVDEGEVEQLQIAQKDPNRLQLVEFPVPGVGEEVTVTEGPLRGLHGEVIDHGGQYYVILRVTAIRQAVRVHVPAAWVQPNRDARKAGGGVRVPRRQGLVCEGAGRHHQRFYGHRRSV